MYVSIKTNNISGDSKFPDQCLWVIFTLIGKYTDRVIIIIIIEGEFY